MNDTKLRLITECDKHYRLHCTIVHPSVREILPKPTHTYTEKMFLVQKIDYLIIIKYLFQP